jgi:thioredoxin reductase (NADPH)
LAGKGVLVSGSRDRREVSGKRVAIVGGGDAALENALILSEFASKVYVIHRRKAFSARSEFVEKVAAKHNVETLYSTTILAINGSERLDSVTTLETDREESRELAVDALLIRIGVEPNSELIAGQVETDERGYITVDRTGRTSLKRVYAVGDVANPVAPTIATSVGTGAAAAKAIAAAIRALS